jgi:serine/threonine protein kinase
MLTREQVAVKIIQKKKLKGDSLELIHKEIDILKSLHHPNIITLYEVLETDRVVFLILELANGGEVRLVVAKALSDFLLIIGIGS